VNGSHAVLANLRAWWKELIIAAMCGLFIAIAIMQSGEQRAEMFTLGGYTAVAVGIGWAIGFSHRHGPIWETIRRMDGKLDQALAPADQPVAKVRHLRGL